MSAEYFVYTFLPVFFGFLFGFDKHLLGFF